MIDLLWNVGLFLLASSSRRNHKQQAARCKLLEQDIEAKEEQVTLLTQQLEDMSVQIQMTLEEKEREWAGRMSSWREETLKIGNVLQGEVRKLEAELGNLKQLDLELNIVEGKQSKYQLFTFPKKVAVREAQKLNLRSLAEAKDEEM